jgi:hypothetical protein
MLRPASANVDRGQRPAFVVAVYNRGKRPMDLRVTNITASGLTAPIHVYSYEELVAEAKRKQRWAAFAVALGGAAGALSAANAGYSHTTGTYSGYSSGRYSGSLNGSYSGSTSGVYSSTTYDAGRAYAAQSINNAQTAANMAAVQENGQARLAELQEQVLKDNTVLPGEWVGGLVLLDAPHKAADGIATYRINVRFGDEVHEFAVTQAKS